MIHPVEPLGIYAGQGWLYLCETCTMAEDARPGPTGGIGADHARRARLRRHGVCRRHGDGGPGQGERDDQRWV